MCSRQRVRRLFALFIIVFGFWAAATSTVLAQSTAGTPDPTAAIPDVALIVRGPGVGLDDETRRGLAADLAALEGVSRVTSETVLTPGTEAAGDADPTVFYLALDNRPGLSRSPEVVIAESTEVLAAANPAAEVLVGGPTPADLALAGTFATTARVVLVVAVLIGLGLGLVFGWQRGFLTAASLGFGVLTAGELGRQVAGGFDGSMAATLLPGALAGLVVGTAVAVRLLFWFRDPRGTDGAAMIRRSLVDLGPELVLILVGGIVSTVMVGLMDPGPTPLRALTMGAIAAVAVQAAILAPGLALLVDAREARADLLPISIPDGRDLPLLVLSGVGILLLLLAAFGLGRPGPSLLETADLAEDDPAVVVAELLRTGGGDKTRAVAATASEAASQVDLSEWGRAAAELDSVEWVEVGSTRFSSTGVLEVQSGDRMLAQPAPGVAMVVLTDSARSEAGRAAIAELSDLPLVGGPPTLSGREVGNLGAAGSLSTTLMAVFALALTGAIAVRVLTQSVGQSIVSFLLRALGGMVLLGLFGLLSSEPPVAVMVTALGVVGFGVWLFELEFLTRFHQRTESQELDGANPGQAGAIGLVALGVCGIAVALASPFGGGPGTGLLGVVIAIGVAIELAVGALLLRPALLGQRAAFHTAVRPVRVALHSGIERAEQYGGVEDPGWRRIIGDLLQAEFRFQSQPGNALLSAVFVPDTPLYRQAAAHHKSLSGAGLRIVGKSPRLRSIKTVSGRAPITLAVTVDHPIRHLVDGEGTIVGVRKAERRSGILWLSDGGDGSYRIAESVELGSASLPDDAFEDETNGTDRSDMTDIPGLQDLNRSPDETDDASLDEAEPEIVEQSGDHGHSEGERLGS